MFQKYRTMTNRKYRIITNLMIPLGIMIITIVLWKYFGYLTDLFMVGVFMTAEVMEDYFGFGSICKKNQLGMDFLKNGYHGMKYFEDAIIVDLFLRPVRIAVYAFVVGWPYLCQGGSAWVVLELAALASVISIASVNIMRYIDMAQLVYTCAIVFVGIYMAFAVILYLYGNIVMTVVLGIGLMAVTAMTYYHMACVIRKSYIDR